jgi:hypothetical protein
MPPSRRHTVNSWLGVGLLCSITLWVTIFYVVEAKKITNDIYSANYKTFYSVSADLP